MLFVNKKSLRKQPDSLLAVNAQCSISLELQSHCIVWESLGGEIKKNLHWKI